MSHNFFPIAHVRLDNSTTWHEHALYDHLDKVGNKAAEFAHVFSAADWAMLAGLWHDLGKYSHDFQCYIRKESGYEADAHIEGTLGRVNHSTAGALHACSHFPEQIGIILAYLIAGHHAGLPDGDGSKKSLSYRLKDGKTKQLLEKALAGNPPSALLSQPLPLGRPPAGSSVALWIRMLFSCLVDADFSDTEAFMAGGVSPRKHHFCLSDMFLETFTSHMEALQASAPASLVNTLRADILQQVIAKAALPPGHFSLTVPTGGGKTLASMAFALHHAKHHGKRRIIYVIPYTSIIEQTAAILKNIFGEDYVIEHHSNAEVEESKESQQSRLACDNWDAPIIVTTNVQFFESLFAARTSRVRKLHNICNSVVVLDEAQLLPPDFLQPIVTAMNELVAAYGVTFVMSTATQPALTDSKVYNLRGIKGCVELIDHPRSLYEQLKRVEVQLPADWDAKQSWEEIANELIQHESVLCIVNTRASCRALFALMPEGTYHLSALMCGEHRLRIINEIKMKLTNKQPVRVISTQLVEAGVDMDFPVIYRAMAGLDSIAQAAGRCNREGRLQQGRVVVFIPPVNAPAGLLQKAESTARQLLKDVKGDPLTPHLFTRYFERLYWHIDRLDKYGIEDDLHPNKTMIAFRTAAEKFRLIDDTQLPVIVRYGENNALITMLEQEGPKRWLMRKLQRYVVTLPQDIHKKLREGRAIKEVSPGVFVQVTPLLYDETQGFMQERGRDYRPAMLVSG